MINRAKPNYSNTAGQIDIGNVAANSHTRNGYETEEPKCHCADYGRVKVTRNTM
jgi:hypothetical protein